MRRLRHWIGTLVVVCGAIVACRRDDGSPQAGPASSAAADAGERRPIELFSWWARIGESDALGALMREHQKSFSNDLIINASAELSGLARKTLRTRMLRNEPPDTFQANVGEDLMQWVIVNGLDARESKLAALDDVLPEDVATWRKVMPPLLLNELSYDGKLYAVPSNVHRLNVVFYNKKVFAAHGLSEPRSVEDLDKMADKLRGTGVALIALGSREPWTMALLVFECLLVALEGPTFYNDYFRGNLAPNDPRMLRVLRAGLKLLDHTNEDHARLSWLQALELVVRGRAAMTVMGDWARVSFNAHGLKLEEDYGELPFPGTSETFVYTSDTFPLPLQAKNKAGALRLLTTIGSKEGQRAMNLAKGSLSARTDVPPQEDAILRHKHELLHNGALALALSGLVAPQFAEDVANALAEMGVQHDIEPVVHTLRSRYALLK